jgi:hypothetical protein
MFSLALLRLALLIVVISICRCLRNVGSRVPVAYRLGILLMGSVSLVNQWLKSRYRFDLVFFFSLVVELNNHVL